MVDKVFPIMCQVQSETWLGSWGSLSAAVSPFARRPFPVRVSSPLLALG